MFTISDFLNEWPKIVSETSVLPDSSENDSLKCKHLFQYISISHFESPAFPPLASSPPDKLRTDLKLYFLHGHRPLS